MIAQNIATSQKRDNQRAERNAQQEAYHAHALQDAGFVASYLNDTGFTLTQTRDVDGITVATWQSDAATIKQTPYTIKVYNGQPARLGKHADAELVNRMQHGWCQRGEATGYAAGIVAALLPLIETPDPYMQALDAMEGEGKEMISYARGHFSYGGATAIDAREITSPEQTPECLAHDLDDNGYVNITYGTKEINGAYVTEKKYPTPTTPEGGYLARQWSADMIAALPAISGGSQDVEDDETACGAICQENNDRAWAKLDTKCPGFYSSQAGAWLSCTESKNATAEHCDGCTRAIQREEDHEMAMDRLDQWGR